MVDSVARFPHALNRCIDNCTSAGVLCLNYVFVKGLVELALGMTSTGFWRFGRGGNNSILIDLMLMEI